MKEQAFSEWFRWVLSEAQLVDDRYPVKGTLVYRRWALFIINKMRQKLEEMLEAKGHEPVLFPVMIPEEILGKETQHIAGFEDQVFWVQRAGGKQLKRKLALRPTSETPIYEMFRLWIKSHRDLPLKVHQSCAVYRYETKHTRPLIRMREFLWNEGHAAHATEEDAKRNVEEVKNTYKELIEDFLCLPVMINERPDWDRFPGAVETYAFDTLTPDNRVLQVATVHNLGQNFSRVFQITYEDEKGQRHYVYQTSYGPSFSRLFAALIAIHGDDVGLILPPELAPVQVVVIPIPFRGEEKEKLLEYAREVCSVLSSEFRTQLDDSEERPGAKYYRWELKGVPVRAEVGAVELRDRCVTLVRRDTRAREKVKLEDAVEEVRELLSELKRSVRERAKKAFEARLLEAEELGKLSQLLEHGVVSCGWCGSEECLKPIKDAGDVLGVNREGKRRCLVCGKAGIEVRVGRSY